MTYGFWCRKKPMFQSLSLIVKDALAPSCKNGLGVKVVKLKEMGYSARLPPMPSIRIPIPLMLKVEIIGKRR